MTMGRCAFASQAPAEEPCYQIRNAAGAAARARSCYHGQRAGIACRLSRSREGLMTGHHGRCVASWCLAVVAALTITGCYRDAMPGVDDAGPDALLAGDLDTGDVD